MTIFSDGFESNDFSAWTASFGGISVSTVRAHTGTHSATWVGGGAVQFCQKDLGSNYTEVYARFYIYFSALGSQNSHTDFFSLLDVNNYRVIGCVQQYGGIENFALFDADFNLYDSGVPIILGQWYCVEIAFKSDAVSGFVKMWIDGLLKINQPLSNAGLQSNRVQMGEGVFGGVTMTGWGDDVVVDSSYIGPMAGAVAQVPLVTLVRNL